MLIKINYFVFRMLARRNSKADVTKSMAKNVLRIKTPKTLGDQEVAGAGQAKKAISGISI